MLLLGEREVEGELEPLMVLLQLLGWRPIEQMPAPLVFRSPCAFALSFLVVPILVVLLPLLLLLLYVFLLLVSLSV